MSKKNELDTYIRKAKKGDKDAYRKIIELLYDEIYNLTAFIYDDDETKEKLTKHLFIKAYKNMPEYDSEECDIHLWMAREATKELYKVVCDREDEIFSNEIEQKEYNYDSIEDDDDLGEASAEFNEAFLTDTGFDNEEGCFASLTIGEKIIYLLYCYEGYSVDEIESIMDIDSSFITSEIASMRDGILAAYAPIKAENADENEDALADESDAVAAAPVSSEDDYSDSDYDDEDDIDILDDEKPVRKAVRPSSADKKKYAIGGLRLTEKELKGVIVGVFAAVVLIVVIVVVMVVSGHNKDNGNSQTTKASVTATKTTPAASTKASTEAATTEEETTTTAAPRRPQSGPQPDVNISTTAAPTEAPTQPSTEAQTAKPTQKPTEATTAAKETTTAPANVLKPEQGGNSNTGGNSAGGVGSNTGNNAAGGAGSNTGNNAAGGAGSNAGNNAAGGAGSDTGNNAAGGAGSNAGNNAAGGAGSNTGNNANVNSN